MTDRAAEAQAAADRWSATVDRLRAEIATREASGRATKALDNARASLARAESHAAAARERVEILARKARAAEAKAARQAAADAALGRRLDKIAEAAPQVMKRWAQERKDEPKRIEKRKKAVAKRTTKDLRSGFDPKAHFGIGRRRRAATEPPVAETFPTGPIIPYAPTKAPPPDRPGLLPGDFRLVDRPQPDAGVDRTVPKIWDARYVGVRMVEAHAVLRRLPMVTRPKEFGANWPEYIHQGVELAYQAGAGTLHQNRGRQIRGTSAEEVARMNEALAWPLQYLNDSHAHAWAVNEWAFEAGLDDEVRLDALANEALEHIAAKLNAGKVKVS